MKLASPIEKMEKNFEKKILNTKEKGLLKTLCWNTILISFWY